MNEKPTISELANMISEDDPRDPGAELAGRLQDRGSGAQPLKGAKVSHFPKGAQKMGTITLAIDFGGYAWNIDIPEEEFNDALRQVEFQDEHDWDKR